MALVREETKHKYLDVEIMVSQRQRGEVIDDWNICHLEVNGMRRRTPDELVELGEWLITQGKRIKSVYRKNGATRTTPSVIMGDCAEPEDALAHEIWAAAQLTPGEGIVDGVDRIAAILKGNGNG